MNASMNPISQLLKKKGWSFKFKNKTKNSKFFHPKCSTLIFMLYRLSHFFLITKILNGKNKTHNIL
jgi:hypothetical protein